MKHVKRMSTTTVPALAGGGGGVPVLDCISELTNGDPLCCGYPSFIDCVLCDFGLGSCKNNP